MPGVSRRLRQPLLLITFALALVVIGAYASVVPVDESVRLNKVQQAGEIAAEQTGMMLQADVAVACLIVQSFPEAGLNQSAFLAPVVIAFVHNHPTVSNILIVDSTGRIVLDILHHDPLAPDGGGNLPSNVPPGEWRNLGRESAGGMQSMLVHVGEGGATDAYFGVLHTERGASARRIYVLNAAHVMPVSSMNLGQTWLLGDDGAVLARSDLQDATLDPGDLGQHWRSMHAGGQVSGALTMSVGGREHRMFYRQLDGWPATLVIDAGPVDGSDSELGVSPVVKNGVALCLVLAAGALSASAFAQLKMRSPEAKSAASNGHDVQTRQLAGKIAHDFNNLLMVMTIDADRTATSDDLDNAQGGRRRLMLEATKHGVLLTQTLLAYSERLILHETVVDLRVLLEQRHAEYSEVLLPGQVLLALAKPGSGAAFVKADAGALSACLLNMLHHIAAMAAPTATIRIDLRVADSSGMVVLAMSDTQALDCKAESFGGIGQMAEFRPNLHDHRMGLALSAAAGFARQSGGAIDVACCVESLRISLSLPVHVDGMIDVAMTFVAPSNPQRGTSLLPKMIASHPSGPVRVLVADDNILVRHSVVRWLGSNGYIVMTADSVAQAEALLSDDIDILITDIVFGDVEDGFALASKARAMDPLLPLVFMSGFMSARQPLLLAGDELASFLRKPIGGEELRAVVEGLLALRETRRLQPDAKLTQA